MQTEANREACALAAEWLETPGHFVIDAHNVLWTHAEEPSSFGAPFTFLTDVELLTPIDERLALAALLQNATAQHARRLQEENADLRRQLATALESDPSGLVRDLSGWFRVTAEIQSSRAEGLPRKPDGSQSDQGPDDSPNEGAHEQLEHEAQDVAAKHCAELAICASAELLAVVEAHLQLLTAIIAPVAQGAGEKPRGAPETAQSASDETEGQEGAFSELESAECDVPADWATRWPKAAGICAIALGDDSAPRLPLLTAARIITNEGPTSRDATLRYLASYAIDCWAMQSFADGAVRALHTTKARDAMRVAREARLRSHYTFVEARQLADVLAVLADLQDRLVIDSLRLIAGRTTGRALEKSACPLVMDAPSPKGL